ncbi:MAG TPA: ABC transporter substrate-binding protein [Stellaceae bacterium]|nr:ABC transporter substrate-binding protein [Stellaceae bacterium]
MTKIWVAIFAVIFSWTAIAAAESLPAPSLPDDYPSNYGGMVAAATAEQKIVVYATTERLAANPLIADFEARFPGIKVDYRMLLSGDIYDRVVAETPSGKTADVVWSSAMDLQMKLQNDGYAANYPSPEADDLPPWAVWHNEAYGVTFEPIVFAYNKNLVPPSDVPQTHADLIRLLDTEAEKYKGRLSTYDPERSNVGFLFITQDALKSERIWDLVIAAGQSGVRLYAHSELMLDRIVAGDSFIGFNVIGSYALSRIKDDPQLGIVFPSDYTQVMSRIAFIPKAAVHPNAARVFLDYLLSQSGQSVMANQSGLFPIRDDVEGEATLRGLTARLGLALAPIRVGPGLMVYLDQAKQRSFLKKWRQSLDGR